MNFPLGQFKSKLLNLEGNEIQTAQIKHKPICTHKARENNNNKPGAVEERQECDGRAKRAILFSPNFSNLVAQEGIISTSF